MSINRNIPPLVGIVLGMTLFEVGNTFQYLITPVFYPNLMRLIGVLSILISLHKASFQRLEGNISVIFDIMLFWTILIVCRGSLIGNYIPGSDTSFTGIFQRAFLSNFGAASYFIPFIALIVFSFNSLYYLKRMAILFCILALFMSFFFRQELIYGLEFHGVTTMAETEDADLTVRHLVSALYPGFGVIVMFLFLFNYIKGWGAYLFPMAIFLFFISMAIGGGRGQTGLNLAYLLVFFYLNIKYPLPKGNNKDKASSKLSHSFSYLLLGAAFVLMLIYLYTNTSIFDYLLTRSFGEKTLGGDFNTSGRNILRMDMINDFNNRPWDWLLGRGVNGAYQTGFLSTEGYRIWMEYGYLYLILKGGIVYLVLFVYCQLHATYLGFFKSNNIFSKCLATMCLMLLLNLISAGAEPQFSTFFLMSWVCFGLLERRQVRTMSDETIYGYINNKNYYQ